MIGIGAVPHVGVPPSFFHLVLPGELGQSEDDLRESSLRNKARSASAG